jgi:DNA-binding FrmR family transcriptional regulator
MLPLEVREDLIRRLRKIEGQTQGIQRMVEEGRDCREVLNQLESVRAATLRVSQELLRCYALARLRDPSPEDAKQAVDEVLSLVLRTRS